MNKKSTSHKKKEITYKKFLDSLGKRGIGPTSPKIPSDLPSSGIWDVPPSECIVSIPEKEDFPLLPPPSFIIPSKDVKSEFCSVQVETVVTDLDFDTKGSLIEIPEEFSSPEQFLQFKTALATQIEDYSKQNGLNPPLKICKMPLCTHICPPSFSFCLNHIIADSRFKHQKLLNSCETINENSDWPVPCGFNRSHCVLHQNVV